MAKFCILHVFTLGKDYTIHSQKDKQERKRKIRKKNNIKYGKHYLEKVIYSYMYIYS